MTARRRTGVARFFFSGFLFGAGALLLALLLLAFDGWRALQGGSLGLSPLGEIWYRLHPASLELLQRLVMHHAAFLWDPLIAALLRLPPEPILLLLGLALCGKRDRVTEE